VPRCLRSLGGLRSPPSGLFLLGGRGYGPRMRTTHPSRPRVEERLEKRLQHLVAKASKEFNLLEPGDRILCGLSGGKDSYAMMMLLREVQRRAPFAFTLIGVNLDQGHPGFEQQVIADWCEAEGFEHRMLQRDTYSVVKSKVPEGRTYCSLCSRLRRGILYDAAVELGCNKIALGHHRDDTIQTLLLNLLFAGQIKAMPPRLRSDDGRNVVIRPLIACEERDLAEYAANKAFPILPCDLCGSQENLQRQQVKRMIEDWSEKNPTVKASLFASLSNVKPGHLLDPKLHAAFAPENEDDQSVV
jgi:tRNA 2-thiocytidine biosynthesis protein TtcA